MDFIECACSGKSLTRLIRPVILAILANESLHGYLINQRLEQWAMFKDNSPDVSGIYRTLKSMEEEKLIVSAWDFSDNAMPKRCFKVTPLGVKCLTQWIKTLESYQNSVKEILSAARLSLVKN